MFDLATGENKQLYSGLGHAQTPTGSRNGTISFLSYRFLGWQSQTSLLTVHDGKIDTILVPDSLSWINNPCISPDGANILFLLVEPHGLNGDAPFYSLSVNIVDVRTRAITRLVDSHVDAPGGATWVDSPTWTTDGQVIYIGYDEYDSRLWIRDISGNSRVLLTREQLINGLKKGRVH
jgi:Tol biopolymer transport system component